MFADLIATLQAMPPERLLLLEIMVVYCGVVLLGRFFGAVGLSAWVVLAVVLANLQVLKPVSFELFGSPVALGTVVFASTFLATDILTEQFGREAARRAVFLGFSAFLAWTVLTTLTLGYRPLTAEEAGADLGWAVPNHDAMAALFLPQPAIFVASMAAFLTSQLCDVWLFDRIRGLTRERHLWLRNTLSTIVSSLIDNTVFSVLAWVVLTPTPVGTQALIETYILGTFVFRVALALVDTPFMYAARLVMPRRRRGLAYDE